MKVISRLGVYCLLIGVALAASAAPPDATRSMTLTATEWNNQGSAFFQRAAYADAERCFLQANHLANAKELPTISFNLAAVYRAEARYDKAEPLYLKALSLEKKQNNPSELLRILNGLTLLYFSERNLTQAEAYGRQAVAVRIDANHFSDESLNAMNSLAQVLLSEGRSAEAETLAHRVLASPAGPQPTNLQRMTAYDTLGRISLKRLDYTAAERNYRQAATLLASTNGADTAAAASLWNDLGKVKAATGDFNGAEAYSKRSIATLQRIYGPNHPDVAASLRGLADVYRDRKHYQAAETLYRQVLTMDEKTFGPESPNVAGDLNSLGSLAFREGHLDRAQALFSRALRLDTTLLGPKDPELGTVAGNLAIVYWRQHRFSDAEPLFAQAAAIREAHYGPADPILANLLSEDALVLRADHRYAEAEAAQVRATRTQVKRALQTERAATD